MIVKLVLDQKEINQLQDLRRPQDEFLRPDTINLFVSPQAVNS